MMVNSRPSPSRIPVPRSFTASATPVSSTTSTSSPPNTAPEKRSSCEDLRKTAAISVRLACSTPTFNQSTKFSNLVSSHQLPATPTMQRGQGICNLWKQTDPLASDHSTAASSSSGSLSRKSSRLRLRFKRSKNSLRGYSSSDGSSDGPSSRASSPELSPILTEKALPPLPPLFSLCTSPIDQYSDLLSPVCEMPPPPPSRFRIRRKPAPEYIPIDALPTPDSPLSFESSLEEGSDGESASALQNVGPNVFIAYDHGSSFALATAFTHVIRLMPAHEVGSGILRAPRSEATFDPETGTHMLVLPVHPPDAPPRAQPTTDSSLISDVSPINESHGDIRFSRKRHRKFRVRRKPVPDYVLPSLDPDWSSVASADDITEAPRAELAFSYADLVATQEFLAASGRVVSLTELAYFLSDAPAPCAVPPLGLQPIQIQTALAFLRPHPFALGARRRVLVLVPRGQLALEGLALMACYIATVEHCSVPYALRKFERSVGTVLKPWQGLLGSDGVIAAYLEELLLAAQAGS